MLPCFVQWRHEWSNLLRRLPSLLPRLRLAMIRVRVKFFVDFTENFAISIDLLHLLRLRLPEVNLIRFYVIRGIFIRLFCRTPCYLHLNLKRWEEFLFNTQVLHEMFEIREFPQTSRYILFIFVLSLLFLVFLLVWFLLLFWRVLGHIILLIRLISCCRHSLVESPCHLQRVLPFLINLNNEIIILSNKLFLGLKIVEAKVGHRVLWRSTQNGEVPDWQRTQTQTTSRWTRTAHSWW